MLRETGSVFRGPANLCDHARPAGATSDRRRARSKEEKRPRKWDVTRSVGVITSALARNFAVTHRTGSSPSPASEGQNSREKRASQRTAGGELVDRRGNRTGSTRKWRIPREKLAALPPAATANLCDPTVGHSHDRYQKCKTIEKHAPRGLGQATTCVVRGTRPGDALEFSHEPIERNPPANPDPAAVERMKLLSPRRKSTEAVDAAGLVGRAVAAFRHRSGEADSARCWPGSPSGCTNRIPISTGLWQLTLARSTRSTGPTAIAYFNAKKFLSFQLAKLLDTLQNPLAAQLPERSTTARPRSRPRGRTRCSTT